MAGAELLPGMETAMDAIIVARLSCRGRSMPPKRPDGDLPSEWEDNDLLFPYFPYKLKLTVVRILLQSVLRQ